MLDSVADALQNEDYKTAARLLKQLKKEQPKNPWVHLYIGRFYEQTQKLEAAEKIYRQLLKGTTNPNIISKARQGLGRLQNIASNKRQEAITQAITEAGGEETGVLVLQPLPKESKQAAAQKFAEIMEMDAYSARLQLPSRGWRLYRTGKLGKLQYYVSSLQAAEVPCFCAAISAVEKINVYEVSYFETLEPTPKALCHNQDGQLGTLNFEWEEVSQRVEGLLPIFEEVEEMDVRRQYQTKTKILDYTHVYDLHLPKKNSIVRLCDRNYQFKQGVALADNTTARQNWYNLRHLLEQQLSQTSLWSDFKIFAETATDFSQMLQHLKPHLNLGRSQQTTWDTAFQLYSCLILLRSQ